MKRIKLQTNINQLLEAIPESTQEVICGGFGTDGSVRFLSYSDTSISQVGSVSSGTYFTGYVKVSDD